MKKIFWPVVALLVLALLSLWGYGNYSIWIGRKESSWLTEEMWGGGYFSATHGDLVPDDVFYLKSLVDGSSKSQDLIGFVVKNKCYDSSWRCSLIMTAASNLMLDNDQYEVGLRGFIDAYGRIKGQCSILYESSIVRYQTRKLTSNGSPDAKVRATNLLEKIERTGGIATDLRSPECRNLALEKPEYFVAYASLVANLMQVAGGKYTYASVYIHSLKKD